jgi:hypothetical protein
MIRELIIGVSVAVIGVGAHAATAQAAEQGGSCSFTACISNYDFEFCDSLGWEICRSEAPSGCVDEEATCISGFGGGCGGTGYVQCDGIQIE